MTVPTRPYVRPAISLPVFHDASGAVIDYGNRWGIAGPPEDSYSVTSNLERFAPVHTSADALINHLTTRYDAVVDESVSYAADLLNEQEGVTRAVRVTPTSADAAGITFVFTAFPGVIVHAGVLQDLRFPDCGCDACDESGVYQAEELEWQVLAVAAGGFRETMTSRPRAKYAMDLKYPGGSIGSHGRSLSEYPTARVRAARETLKGLADGWQPWPERAAGGVT
ncbi:DUF6226 family protein [Demequina oxidasica]|uniref:DUF6226 family protein n=1 Tax=Demequina oxidasica TaxID=676199 RepID=UPI0007844AAF|nr:DUF6226 family protein [Demequina oxidasica]